LARLKKVEKQQSEEKLNPLGAEMVRKGTRCKHKYKGKKMREKRTQNKRKRTLYLPEPKHGNQKTFGRGSPRGDSKKNWRRHKTRNWFLQNSQKFEEKLFN